MVYTYNQGNGKEAANVNAAELIAIHPYICKTLATPTNNQKASQLGMDMEKS